MLAGTAAGRLKSALATGSRVFVMGSYGQIIIYGLSIIFTACMRSANPTRDGR